MMELLWCVVLGIWGLAAEAQKPEGASPGDAQIQAAYLSDQPHRILYAQQAWGDLGLNVCAHARGQKALPLQIGQRTYEKGLGHHAPGEMIVLLGGEFARFESEIGVQAQQGSAGSVVFKVFVDDQEKFDSGVMKGDTPARRISIPVEGASELRLVVGDAGDGITCDCANWAEARLVRSESPKPTAPGTILDVAPFGEVVTCDPARMDGARSTRIQEYRAEDVFLETPIPPDGAGRYAVPASPAGQCIGLRWLERRMITGLGIEFDGEKPEKAGVQVQCWVGEGLRQGKWQTLGGTLMDTENGFRMEVDWSKTPEARGGTRKIRWIFNGQRSFPVIRLSAMSPTRLGEVKLRITREKQPSTNATTGRIEVYSGEIVSEAGRTETSCEWPPGKPLALTVRYAKPRPWKSDRTVLRFRLPDTAFGVAVDDVIRDGGVYVRDVGLFVSLDEMNRDAAGYLASVREKKTVLQRVREMPDQTFAQAIEHVHNPKQNLQPMLLSLACDNHKFVVHRDGTILFSDGPDQADLFRVHQLQYPREMRPRFGSGNGEIIGRRLEGGWLPAPVTEVRDGGWTYRQRTYVVSEANLQPRPPADSGGAFGDGSKPSPWLEPRPVCVVEFSVEGQAAAGQGPPRVELTFLGDVKAKQPAEADLLGASYKGKRIAQIEGLDAQLGFEVEEGTLSVRWGFTRPTVRLLLFGDAIDRNNSPPELGLNPFERFTAYWQRVMAPVMQAELPDPLLTNVLRASQVHCLLAARNEDEGRRIAPWIASFTYGPLESESNSIVRGMDYWGHHEFSKRGLDFFINKYAPSGMLTTGYTLMGLGWHLWSLGEHYRLTQDQAWLRGVAPKVAKACQWIVEQREKTKKELPTGRPPQYGLAPPGVMADWYSYNYFFCLNGYYYKGLLEAAQALAGVGHEGADGLLAQAKAYRDDILRAYHWTQARMPVYPLKDGTSVPGYPSQLDAPGPTNNFFPGEDGNRSWCYDVELGAHQLVPQGVLDPASREVGDMMDHMEDVQFLADGWFDYPAERNEKDWYNLGGFAKVQPYYCRNIEIYALRDEVKPFIRSYFNTIPSLLGMETLSFQEHFAGVAAWNKTHETGYFLLYSRLMLVQERGDELWLMPFVPVDWLKDGATISVKNAPTTFGPVSYEFTSHMNDRYIEGTVTWPTRARPRSIAIRARHPEGRPIRSASVQVGEDRKGLGGPDAKDKNVFHIEHSAPVARVRIEF